VPTVGFSALRASDPDDIRDSADEILSRPEYQEAEPGLMERALDWVLERLGAVLGSAVGGQQGYLVGYAILVAALVAAGYLLWRVFPRGGGLRPRSTPTVVSETITRLSRAQWLARAGEAEAAARWDDAVHARYHALTTGLADRHELSPELSVTSGEHRHSFTRGAVADAGRVQAFDGVTERFEEVWFGGAAAEPQDSRALVEADRRLLSERQ
jgi:hypothetical protein